MMARGNAMDETDRTLLDCLQEDGRMTASEVARRLGLSVPATSDRMRKLEDTGVILGYTARVDRRRVGRGLLAYVFVDLERPDHRGPFREAVVARREVLECHHVAGASDYLLKVAVADTDALEAFLSDGLKGLAGVVKTNTVIVLSSLKEGLHG